MRTNVMQSPIAAVDCLMEETPFEESHAKAQSSQRIACHTLRAWHHGEMLPNETEQHESLSAQSLKGPKGFCKLERLEVGIEVRELIVRQGIDQTGGHQRLGGIGLGFNLIMRNFFKTAVGQLHGNPSAVS